MELDCQDHMAQRSVSALDKWLDMNCSGDFFAEGGQLGILLFLQFRNIRQPGQRVFQGAKLGAVTNCIRIFCLVYPRCVKEVVFLRPNRTLPEFFVLIVNDFINKVFR